MNDSFSSLAKESEAGKTTRLPKMRSSFYQIVMSKVSTTKRMGRQGVGWMNRIRALFPVDPEKTLDKSLE